MKSQRTNSTFANSNTQADTSVCKRAISCHSHLAKNKRTGSTKKQSFQLTNFCPFGAMTAWRWRKSIRVIIKSNYFSTFYAFVATFTRFFSSCVHKIKFKGLKTCSTLFIVERLFTTFLGQTTFTFSVTVVEGLRVASLSGTNCPVRASRTLVDVLLMTF